MFEKLIVIQLITNVHALLWKSGHFSQKKQQKKAFIEKWC